MSGAVYFCCDKRRRAQVRSGGGDLNGIDFLEVADAPGAGGAQRLLRVVLVKPASAALQARVGPDTVHVRGGDRVRGIRVASTAWTAPDTLEVTVGPRGDFTLYTLVLEGSDGKRLPEMDPLLSAVDFSFKASCPGDADCLPRAECAPEPGEEPEIDYLAKDYTSFRQLMLDRMSLVLPGWRERNPADVGVALVELLAYVGDYLSYRQDAVASEAYLGTARLRTSVRRHARLLDYPMHDGCNARVWVHLEAARLAGDDPAAGIPLPAGVQLFTRVPGRGALLDADPNEMAAVMAAGPEVFETMHSAVLRPEHNRMPFYAWGEQECCLAEGATRATLAGHFPALAPGDVLVFEEVLGPRTGQPGDADPARRHAVRLTLANAWERPPGDPSGDPALPLSDPAFRRLRTRVAGLELRTAANAPVRVLAAGEELTVLAPWAGTAASGGRRRWHLGDAADVDAFLTALPAQVEVFAPPLTELAWDAEDSLPFALCLSAVVDASHGGRLVEGVSVARGNVVLADHGRTVPDERLPAVPAPDPRLAPAGAGGCGCGCSGDGEHAPPPARFLPRLLEAPVTQAARIPRPPGAPQDGTRPFFDPAAPAAAAFAWDMARVLPAVALRDEGGLPWSPQRDLLASDAFGREFVLEVEEDGAARLRFGDDRHGERPHTGAQLTATYRVGSGARGNVGADSVTHLLPPGGPTLLQDRLLAVRNPLPARGGADPEATERARQMAPAAFRTPERAVTPEDYARMAERHPQVQRAQATVRWTGSWRTVFLTVDRVGALPVDADFEARLRRHLERFRMAGHDLEIDGPRFVPVELEIAVCVDPGYFRADVGRAVRDVLGRGTLPDGRRGLFHPDEFTFGEPVFLSRVYAAVQGVAGVRSAEVRRFRRQGDPATDARDTGELLMGRLEVARLDDDPSHPDRGVLRLAMQGGR
jgi:hypothetical protein